MSDAELAHTFHATLSGHVSEWPQLRPLLGRAAKAFQERDERNKVPAAEAVEQDWFKLFLVARQERDDALAKLREWEATVAELPADNLYYTGACECYLCIACRKLVALRDKLQGKEGK